MKGLIETYYQQTTRSEATLLKRGQLCRGPVGYTAPNLSVLQLVQYEPRDERQNKYKILSNPPSNTLFDHTPIHELNLASNEELIMVKAKIRPLLVLSNQSQGWLPGGVRLAEDTRICAPLYSFHDNDSPEFRDRIQRHEYPWWLYLPEDRTLRMNEGFLRLDRIQVSVVQHLRPQNVALTDDAVYIAGEWSRYHLTGSIDSVLLEYRETLLGLTDPTSN